MGAPEGLFFLSLSLSPSKEVLAMALPVRGDICKLWSRTFGPFLKYLLEYPVSFFSTPPQINLTLKCIKKNVNHQFFRTQHANLHAHDLI